MSWTSRFEPPIPLPDGGELETLDQARAYVIALPKSVHDTAAWRTAIEVLLLVGENGGPPDFARIGMMQALYPQAEPEYDPKRREPAWRWRAKV
jgi:hypothetical protein